MPKVLCRQKNENEKCAHCIINNTNCTNNLKGVRSREERVKEKERRPLAIQPTLRKCNQCLNSTFQCVRQSEYADCDNCIKVGKPCITKERAQHQHTNRIPEDRCQKCASKRNTTCDGKIPCNLCIKNGLEHLCVLNKDKKSPKCVSCARKRTKCNR